MSNGQPWTPAHDTPAGPRKRDPFMLPEFMGWLTTGIGILGAVSGLVMALDTDGTLAVACCGLAFATLGMILVVVSRIGTGLLRAGKIRQ
ncbi:MULTISPECIES: hypothetical protein [Corynebacterium]|uniref:hypothetical protein n=1 Tax=Corynebacterium TaxID=1716 RepID=UPI00102F9B47|nr:hypothetical protein [Corynebacterium neomassiliense]MCI1255770.1 hypothetical protein [Corynebacterium provencense]